MSYFLNVFSALVAGMALGAGIHYFVDRNFRLGLMLIGLFLLNLALIFI